MIARSEMQPHIQSDSERVEEMGNKFRSVIRSDVAWNSMLGEDVKNEELCKLLRCDHIVSGKCQDEPMLHTVQFPHPLHISIVCNSLLIHTDYFHECKVLHTHSHFHTQPKSEECGMCHCNGIISFVHS